MYNDSNSSPGNPLDGLPPEVRQRVEEALRASGGGAFGGITPSYVHVEVSKQPAQIHLGGNRAWAHWEYGPTEWELFDKIDWGIARRRYWLLVWISTLVCLFIIGVPALFLLVLRPFNPNYALFMAVVAFLLLLALFLLIYFSVYPYSEAKKRHKARQDQAQPQRVTFSERGVWEAGTYFPLNEVLMNLKNVRMTSQPSVLHFKRERIHFRQSSQRDTLRVLVPWGREAEAAQLMQRFRVEVIEAQKRGYSPREPD
jgi:uncharacterized membrane protein